MHSAGPKEAAKLVAMAGGEVVGATRLQKIGCLVDLAGASVGFDFTYHLFGPYSEQLELAISDANALELVDVQQRRAVWGGRYSVFKKTQNISFDDIPAPVSALASVAAKANSVELELAVTAAFLKQDGSEDPWADVAALKKAKATRDHMANAKTLYESFRSIEGLPRALPAI